MDPREIHEFEQLRARLREIAAITAMYRQELVDGGVPEAEAWVEAQEIRRKLSDPTFDAFEAGRDNDVLATVLERIQGRIDPNI